MLQKFVWPNLQLQPRRKPALEKKSTSLVWFLCKIKLWHLRNETFVKRRKAPKLRLSCRNLKPKDLSMFQRKTVISDRYIELCKLAVLPGARLHKLALHYSRVADPSHPGTCFSGLSVMATHWVQARAQQGRTRSDLTRRALIGFRGQWRGSCHSHKRMTTQSPLSCLLSLAFSLFFFILSLVSPLSSVFSLVPSVVFHWTFV